MREMAVACFQLEADGSGTVSTVGLALVIASALAWSIGNLLLREYPVSQVAPLSLLIPLFGIVSSMLILGQWPSALGLAAMLLILLALAVGARPGKAVPTGRQRGGGRRENLQR